MKTKTYKVTLKFSTPILGSQSADPEITSKFAAKRAGLDEPIVGSDECLPDDIDKGTTVFQRVPAGRPHAGEPCFVNYQVLGFLKEAGKVLNGKVEGGVKNLRSKVASYIQVVDRHIPITPPNGKPITELIDYLERPLRAETMQGPRTALARSEMLPEGCSITFGLEVIDSEITLAVLHDLFSYGWMRGLGQWRASGAYGTFSYTIEEE